MYLLITCAMFFSSFVPTAKVLQDDKFSTTIVFNLPDYSLEQIWLDGKVYNRVNLPGAITYLDKGYPELPRLYRNIIIDDFGEYDYRIIDADYETFHVNPILPSKGNLTRDINPDLVPYEFSPFYSEDKWFPEYSINISEPFIIRDYRGLTIHFNPFQYNPQRNELRVCHNITIEVYKTKSQGKNPKIRNQNLIKIAREFQEIYESFFLNFSSTRYDSVLERAGRMVIITANQYYNNMLPFARWKRMKGIPTKLVRYPQETGSGYQAIKTYLQNEYNAGGLVWVLIVGDAGDVPPAPTVGISVTDISDPVYTYLEGNDYYPDAFISRFSANSTADVDNQVNRTITYERTLVTGGNWERKGMGVASNQTGGTPYADSTRCNWLRAMLLGYNYISVDRIYDPYGTIAMVSSGINEGRSIVNYIGHGSTTSWGSTGFSNSNVFALTNTNKLPYIISVACYNGEFDNGTCFGEAWLRAGTPSAPTGAIAFYGSSISQAWVPPTVAQSAACSLLVQDRNHTIGGIMFNGSCHMIAAYLPAMDGVKEFQTWHIFGDASVTVRTLPPQPMAVNHPTVFLLGSNNINISVPGVPNALIGIFKDTLLYGSAYTDASGNAQITFSQPVLDVGYLNITVSAYNKATYFDSIPVIVPNGPFVVAGSTVMNDSNANGQANPGELINYGVWAKNIGVVSAYNVYGKLIVNDSFVTRLVDSAWYGNIAINDSVFSNPVYQFRISRNCPNNYPINFTIMFKDNNDSTFRSYKSIRVYAPVINYQSVAVVGGNNNGIFNRGETVDIVVTLKNVGGANAENVTATLLTSAPNITILDNQGSFGTILPNNSANNATNPFTVCSDTLITPGTMVQFRVAVNYGFYSDTFQFSLPVEIYLVNFDNNNGNFTPVPA
ncbi:MAG: C25 family cysteine peptidase, partial [candidate division WOR-3 bacterium]|nr:C25 family cysteine peptidase [candidate division WOR-3 bacterium]